MSGQMKSKIDLNEDFDDNTHFDSPLKDYNQ